MTLRRNRKGEERVGPAEWRKVDGMGQWANVRESTMASEDGD
jgi:hypothetical protein